MLKPTLPLVITPLVTAAVTGFGSILAASEGSIILAEVSFPIDVVAAVVGVYFGIKRRDMRMLDEIVLDLAPLEGGSEAWESKPDSSFVRLHQRGDEEPLDCQALLLEEGF